MNKDTGNTRANRILHEPLTHFLILGATLFILYANVGNSRLEQVDRIVVDATQVKVLADQFQRTWMRPPTQQELQGLTEDFIKEEVLYREALALGLDQNDLIIRRRMRQKMEFLNADIVEQQTPQDSDLQAYLDDNTERYAEPERASFEQLYFRTDTDRTAAEARASAALKQLEDAADTDTRILGDASLLPASQRLASARDIGRVFGEAFATAVSTAPAGQWSGPYTSTYGVHLLRITQRTPARQAALEDVRSEVERDWYTQQRLEANKRFYEALRNRYTVDIEWPDDATLQTP
jgi:parvulin-like peptidyl-prolyl isomerase